MAKVTRKEAFLSVLKEVKKEFARKTQLSETNTQILAKYGLTLQDVSYIPQYKTIAKKRAKMQDARRKDVYDAVNELNENGFPIPRISRITGTSDAQVYQLLGYEKRVKLLKKSYK